MLNSALISAPAPVPLNQNLLHRVGWLALVLLVSGDSLTQRCCGKQEVFDYDFTRERVFLEISHAQLEAMREAEEQASSESAAAAASYAASEDANSVDEELARQVQPSWSSGIVPCKVVSLTPFVSNVNRASLCPSLGVDVLSHRVAHARPVTRTSRPRSRRRCESTNENGPESFYYSID
jgi:hypothetical protein